MLKTTPTQLAKNLPSDIAENAEVRSGISFTTKSAKNLSLDMAEDAKVGGNSDGGDNETVKKSPSKKSSGPMAYLISLRSDADSSLFKKRWAYLIILTIVEALS